MINSPKPETRISIALLLLAVSIFTGCGDSTVAGSSLASGSPPPGPQVGVTVAPATATISTVQTQQFTATVVNSNNQAVTWRVDGVLGGHASVGVISAGGMYTPPLSEATHSVTATSVADPTKSGSVNVTVRFPPPQISVTVAPAIASISTVQTQQFTATVVNSTNQAVTWRVDGIQGGNASVGLISAGGMYTPPPSEATHSVAAASVADPTKSGSANVTVRLIGVTVTPAAATISTIQTQQFTATVVNSTNQAVTWRVDGIQGGNASVGLISAGGMYTPPLSEATHSVTATSVADPTKSGSVNVTVRFPPPQISVTVAPATATISTVQTQQFTATVVNSTNQAVTWRVDGVQGGNASVGVISAGGMYTPPPSEATHSVAATSVADPTRSGSGNATVRFLSGVLTYHNDNARSGQNLNETVLAPGNVATATFGKLFSFPVDGYVYAQPLYVSKVPVAGQLHNVVFVATEHNSVYAFDADTGGQLWHASFINPANGVTTVPYQDTATPPGYTDSKPYPDGCTDLTPEIGITGTPVIDQATGTLYIVAKTKETNGAIVTYEHRLHALDITTGMPRPGSGRALQASVPGTTAPNDGNGRVLFLSLRQNQRAALLLNNNVVSVAFSSHCVIRPYQGWVLAYDAKTLDLLGAFNAVPNDPKGKGGIWHSGGGPAADANGNVFVMTGDGPFNAASAGNSYGDSVLKLTNGSLTVADYFTPHNQLALEAANADMSSGGPLLLPDQAVGPQRLMVSAGKQGIVYLLNRDNMGRFQVGSDSQIVQSFPGGACGPGSCAIFGTPAYFSNTVYTAAVDDRLRAYSLSSGQLTLAGQSPNSFRWPGATPVVSANGSSNGIVWALETNGSGAPAVLRAYSAANVSVELYNSDENAARDNPGPAVKFGVPTVANGKVYVGSQFQVSVFGLLP